jgi:hypothetical protein
MVVSAALQSLAGSIASAVARSDPAKNLSENDKARRPPLAVV